MRLFDGLDKLVKIENAVVTTGSFDGVHFGHQALIRRLNKMAADINGQSVLITFYPHVRKVLYPETAGKDLELINSQSEKIELLRKTGLQNLVIIRFTIEFAKTSAEDFVKNILFEKLGAKIIVVGYNHYFGHNKEGNYEKLIAMGSELGFRVVEFPRQELVDETIGSTRIRKSLKSGKIMHANAYLENIFFICGQFAPGSRLYRDAEITTFSLAAEEDGKLLPPDGIYAIKAEIDQQQHKGIMLCNHHGTYVHPHLQQAIEIYLPEYEGDCSGKNGKVYVHKELDNPLHIEDPRQLNRQLRQTADFILELIY